MGALSVCDSSMGVRCTNAKIRLELRRKDYTLVNISCSRRSLRVGLTTVFDRRQHTWRRFFCESEKADHKRSGDRCVRLVLRDTCACCVLRSCEYNYADAQFAIMQQIAQGMEHLSAEDIIHRDLAARNVLVMSFDEADALKTSVKITD